MAAAHILAADETAGLASMSDGAFSQRWIRQGDERRVGDPFWTGSQYGAAFASLPVIGHVVAPGGGAAAVVEVTVEQFRERFPEFEAPTGGGTAPAVFTWYSATGDDNSFAAADFLAGSTGTGGTVTFRHVTGGDRYFALATSAPITVLQVGGDFNQIASFPQDGQVTIAGHNYWRYVSDVALFADTSMATFMVR